MSKIAVDVVLLPDDKMKSIALEVNKLQTQNSNEKIILHPETCLPHLSLAMGVIEQNDISEASRILTDIAAGYGPFQLEASDYSSTLTPAGDIVSEYRIKRTDELMAVHAMVLDKLKDLLSHDATVDMLFTPPEIDEISLYWINNYPEHSSEGNFRPHITLGFGKTEEVAAPIRFTSPTLALCHLGNYCTCRKLLWSKQLGK